MNKGIRYTGSFRQEAINQIIKHIRESRVLFMS